MLSAREAAQRTCYVTTNNRSKKELIEIEEKIKAAISSGDTCTYVYDSISNATKEKLIELQYDIKKDGSWCCISWENELWRYEA